jgi:hypothetical protein
MKLFVHRGMLCAVMPGGPVRDPGDKIYCGYVRLYEDHPFIGRLYRDPEVQDLNRHLFNRISYSEGANWMPDDGGWWIGFFDEWFSEEVIVQETKILAEQLMPRRYTKEEYVRWTLQAHRAAEAVGLPLELA